MTPEKKDRVVDLNKLTQRELLILTYMDVQDLKEEMKGVKTREHDTAILVDRLDTKSKVSGGIVGFFTGLITVVIDRLIRS